MKSKKEETGASWWREMLTRREANGRIMKLGITAALIASAGITVGGCGDSEEEEAGADVERDALDLQKTEGWNIGSTDRTLTFNGKSATDSQGSMNWSTYLDPSALLKVYQPKNGNWQPYVVPTLVQSLGQQSLRGQIQPVYSRSMEEAYARGLGMREILTKSKNSGGTMLVVDIPGPEAVAYAAALADVADPVITFDNWPHPLGVVPSHETLGALLFYAGEVAEKSAKRPADAPAVLILDSQRLNAYSDADNQFDNRYLAKLPTADKLSALKVTNLVYAVPNESRTSELDDINEDFALYKEKGLNVAMVPLSNFQPDKNAPATDTTGQNIAGTGAHGTVRHTTYYYGGAALLSPWFFYHYPLFTPRYGIPMQSRLPATSMRGTAYSPVRRPTMFSSRNVGGASGVGKARPSGFGRVSTRVGSNGRTTGVGSGRSGSFGRSRGGWSS
jgi:hypothetical protein